MLSAGALGGIALLGPVLVGSLSDFLSTRPDGPLLSITLVSAPCMLVSAALMTLTIRSARVTLEQVTDTA